MRKIWLVGALRYCGVVVCLVGCKRLPPQTNTATTPACELLRVASVDIVPAAINVEVGAWVEALDREADNKDEIVVVSESGIMLLRVLPSGETQLLWETKARGGPTVVTSGDLDQDGKEDLVVGWGRGRQHLTAPATLMAYLTTGAPTGGLRPEVIAKPQTSRAEFTSASVTRVENGQVGLLFAFFVAKYDVAASFAQRSTDGQWQVRQLDVIRMGSQWAAIELPGRTALIVGRPYGDSQHSFGDVTEWSPDRQDRQALPSVRGVRSLNTVHVGKRPRALICYGAGWHWRYGEQAKGILTCAQANVDGHWEAQIVDELGMYEVSEIKDGDLDGDGTRELIARGPDGIYAYVPTFPRERSRLAGTEWQRRTIASGSSRFAVADLDGDGADEILSAGPPLRLYRLTPARSRSSSPKVRIGGDKWGAGPNP